MENMLRNVVNEIQQQFAIGNTEMAVLDDFHIKKITPELRRELERYKDLISLSLSSCRLSTLENFPFLPSLMILDLSYNPFPPKELLHLRHLPNLK